MLASTDWACDVAARKRKPAASKMSLFIGVWFLSSSSFNVSHPLSVIGQLRERAQRPVRGLVGYLRPCQRGWEASVAALSILAFERGKEELMVSRGATGMRRGRQG